MKILNQIYNESINFCIGISYCFLILGGIISYFGIWTLIIKYFKIGILIFNSLEILEPPDFLSYTIIITFIHIIFLCFLLCIFEIIIKGKKLRKQNEK